jgi:hypothetical protein
MNGDGPSAFGKGGSKGGFSSENSRITLVKMIVTNTHRK